MAVIDQIILEICSGNNVNVNMCILGHNTVPNAGQRLKLSQKAHLDTLCDEDKQNRTHNSGELTYYNPL